MIHGIAALMVPEPSFVQKCFKNQRCLKQPAVRLIFFCGYTQHAVLFPVQQNKRRKIDFKSQ